MLSPNSSPSCARGAARGARRWLAAGLLGLAAAAHAGEAARVVFVAGEVQAGPRALALGDAIQEGDAITTGVAGYVYLKTVDNGLLILRPSTRARIVTYHVDKADPRRTQIKFELLSGVARSVSGDAVKLARQNFRFNTPVAAIGVRGTDFTVSTDAETSRVTVISGAIVVSGFGGNCMPGGAGPCEQGASRELAATQAGQMLQVRRGQPAPQLLSTAGSALAPDTVAPPRADEPVAKAGAAAPAVGEVSLDPQKTESLLTQAANKANAASVPPPTSSTVLPPEQPPLVVPVAQSQLVWGRWQAIANRPATVDSVKTLTDGATEVGRNGYYALFRTPGQVWQSPAQGSIGFSLSQSEAFVINEATRANTAALLENGKLNVDFGTASFTTSFDLVNVDGRYGLQSQGTVSKDGILAGNSQFSKPTNMTVVGALGNENGGSAAYIFTSRLDDKRVANGVTYWRK
ncbi:FecR family protein [Burkholderia sp. LMU1-1-1.1]|uniref:FecR family protein n=1 Tax=Burkholderia sp. LMU1-1-1.1 TaxID=3135266 RepID=UPI0034483030